MHIIDNINEKSAILFFSFFILFQWLFVRRSFHIHSIQDFSPFWLECVQIKSLASIHIFYRTFPFASFGWRIRNRFKRILYGFIYISIENLSGTADYKSYFVHVPSSHLLALPLSFSFFLYIALSVLFRSFYFSVQRCVRVFCSVSHSCVVHHVKILEHIHFLHQCVVCRSIIWSWCTDSLWRDRKILIIMNTY